ncbi:MAG: RecQ family ATP-dependent DNA helicase [Planctomycetes bacterium]|nr:RecQ family ATP-dependent DNA helicase [Planctomycetota bacterium]
MSDPGGQYDGARALERARPVLRDTFGHADFRDGQAQVVASALAARNLLVVMPTGSGKSLLYQLPALLADGLTLVVSPLIALMKDQVDELRRKGAAAALINSSLSPDQQQQVIQQCLDGQIRLLYVAPERFRSSSFVRMLQQVRIARLAVDEAHCISEWGHDFRPDYRRLKQFRQLMGSPPTSALTATATPKVQEDIVRALGLEPAEVEVHVRGFDRPNLALQVVRTRGDAAKIEVLTDLITRQQGSGIIYVGTRRKAEEVAGALSAIEPSLAVYHAGMEGGDRAAAQEAFLTGRARIAVATVAFGMGIDKRDVRFVAHYHFPGSIEQYYQEIGRAGRDGEPSRCVLLYSAADRSLREFFIDLSYPSREQVASVMDALYAVPDNPLMATYRQIAEACDEPVKDGQIGPALRLLSEAGIARALDGDATAAVQLDRPGAQILPALRGKVQRSVFEALAIAGDLETPGELSVDLEALAKAAGLTTAQVQRALGALNDAGHLTYHPPFRGRGVQKLMDRPPPFDEAKIDWERQDFLRGLEEEKLAAMEGYIHGRDCRRAHVVRYFGETTDLKCGTCDRCEDNGGACPRGDSILDRHGRTAAAALLCVSDLRFPLGVGRIAQVITGSRDSKLLQWGLDRNIAYNLAACRQDEARVVIDQLVEENYLRQAGEFDRPTLELTGAGRDAVEQIDLEDLRGTPPSSPAGPAGPMDVRRAALRCVAALPTPLGISKVAEILTGSNAKWIAPCGADRLDVYGRISRPQTEVRETIRSLLAEGLLAQTTHGRYPVLEITAAGHDALAGHAPPQPRVEAPAEDAEPLDVPFDEPPLPPAGPGEVLVSHVRLVVAGERTEAAEAMQALGWCHPARVSDALAEAYRDGDQRARARAVWAAGEVGDTGALPFVLDAASTGDAALRAHAAKALGKLASRTGSNATVLSSAMGRIHVTLQRLIDDHEGPVRAAAKAVVRDLTGGNADGE